MIELYWKKQVSLFLELLLILLLSSCTCVKKMQISNYPTLQSPTSEHWEMFIWPGVPKGTAKRLSVPLRERIIFASPPKGIFIVYEVPETVSVWGWDIKKARWIKLLRIGAFIPEEQTYITFTPTKASGTSPSIMFRIALPPDSPSPPVPIESGGDSEMELIDDPVIIYDCSDFEIRQLIGSGYAENAIDLEGIPAARQAQMLVEQRNTVEEIAEILAIVNLNKNCNLYLKSATCPEECPWKIIGMSDRVEMETLSEGSYTAYTDSPNRRRLTGYQMEKQAYMEIEISCTRHL